MMEMMKHHGNPGKKHGVAIIALACETNGRMGQQFQDLIAEATPACCAYAGGVSYPSRASDSVFR